MNVPYRLGCDFDSFICMGNYTSNRIFRKNPTTESVKIATRVLDYINWWSKIFNISHSFYTALINVDMYCENKIVTLKTYYQFRKRIIVKQVIVIQSKMALISYYSYVQLQLCNHIFMELQGETELFLEKISKYHKDKVKNATCDLNAYLCTQDLIPFYNANIKERST